jgi:hypothetical protein
MSVALDTKATYIGARYTSVLCSKLSSRLPPRSESFSRHIARTRTGAQFELMQTLP